MLNYDILDAHILSVIIVSAGMMMTPLYLFCTYHYSFASTTKGLILASAFLMFGSVMTWVCVSRVPDGIGIFGSLLVPICWVVPSLLLWLGRDWVLSNPLSQKWLVGLQIFRLIGGVFLLEYGRENIPAIFAFPAGFGDILVGLCALTIILMYRQRDELPRWSILLVLIVGIVDFISAFFWGFTSSDGPAQLFDPVVTNNVVMYPTGLIPLFLVPYAIFFHMLSFLSLMKSDR